MYEIILDVYAYMMRFCPCVFLFPRKRKRREVTWCSDFVSNSPQTPPADSISADMKTRRHADDYDDGSGNVGKTNEFVFFQT